MTEATQTAPALSLDQSLALHYQVAMPQPESHLFEITLTVRGWRSPQIDLKMPVWTPGSYLVREYARHVQNFSAQAQQPLPWRKIGKNHWQIDTQNTTDFTVTYRLYANELTVRTNHLDSTHGYFNGAATFFYIPGHEQTPLRLALILPRPHWRVATPLTPVPGLPYTYEATDFDTLVDSPVEMGEHTQYDFEVLGKPHQFVVWGQGNYDAATMIRDTEKIIEVEAKLFGGLPYSRYLFLLHLSSQGFGGLEHKDSCTLNYSRFTFRSPEKYNRFMQLVAHEFFHLWNIKRIRPKALEVFDYEQENYTPSLWFAEGTTSYYDLMIPLRAGIYGTTTFLRELSREVARYFNTPGRQVQPLAESSFDAWIKLYRRDTYSDNNQISYYLKGEMVTLLLDLAIRARHQNRRSMDDVLQHLWQRFGIPETGFSPDELEDSIAAIAECDLSDFFHRYLHTTEELPFDAYLEPFGLRLKTDDLSQSPPFTGLLLRPEHGQDVVKFVEHDSPAQRAGVDAGDEVLALDGMRVTTEQWGDRLRDYKPGDTVELAFFHQDELRTGILTLAPPRPTHYQIVPLAQPTPAQQENLRGWIGVLPSDTK